MSIRMLYRGLFCQTVCVVLALTLAVEPSAAVAQQAAEQAANPVPTNGELKRIEVRPDTTLIAAPDAGKMDVKYVTPQAVVYAIAHPRQFLTSPNATMFPTEVASAAGLQHLGIDPVDVEEVRAFFEPPTVMGISYGVVVTFAKPFDLGMLREQVRAHTQSAEFAGKMYLQSTDPRLPSLYMANETTLLAMPDMTLRRVLTPGGELIYSPLIGRLGALPGGSDFYLAIDIESLRPLINPWLNVAAMKQGKKFPEEAKPFLEVPNLITMIDLAVNVSRTGPTALILHANDDSSAEKLVELTALAKELQRKRAAEAAAQLQQSDDPIQRAMGQYVERMSKLKNETYEPERKGDALILFNVDATTMSPRDQMIVAAVGGILVALLLPAIQAAREAARIHERPEQLLHEQ